jgi:CheY-like chemotaxis protein
VEVVAKIMLVEDYKLARDLYSSLLGERGHEVVVAKDGKEGVKKLAGGYDLYLIDLVIPKVGAVDLVREVLRQRGEEVIACIVMLYTVGEEGLLDGVKELGVSNFILKSTTDHEGVVDEIEKLLST